MPWQAATKPDDEATCIFWNSGSLIAKCSLNYGQLLTPTGIDWLEDSSSSCSNHIPTLWLISQSQLIKRILPPWQLAKSSKSFQYEWATPHPNNRPKSEPQLPKTPQNAREFNQEQKQTKRLTKQKLCARIFLPTLASASPGRSEPTGGPQTCYLKLSALLLKRRYLRTLSLSARARGPDYNYNCVARRAVL